MGLGRAQPGQVKQTKPMSMTVLFVIIMFSQPFLYLFLFSCVLISIFALFFPCPIHPSNHLVHAFDVVCCWLAGWCLLLLLPTFITFALHTNNNNDDIQGKVSHESIKQLVLEAEHLVRDEALKTPTKQKQHSINGGGLVQISSTIKKREVSIMPGPIKRVQVSSLITHHSRTSKLIFVSIFFNRPYRNG